MKTLETPLIKNRAKRQLSALGQKQLDRLISKAAETMGTNRHSKEFKPITEQIRLLVYSLVFDHNITKEQLSNIQKLTKINNTTLELPSMAS